MKARLAIGVGVALAGALLVLLALLVPAQDRPALERDSAPASPPVARGASGAPPGKTHQAPPSSPPVIHGDSDASLAVAAHRASTAEQALERALKLPPGHRDRVAVLNALRRVCDRSKSAAYYDELVNQGQLWATVEARKGFQYWTQARERFCGKVARDQVVELLVADARAGASEKTSVFLDELGHLGAETKEWRITEEPELAAALSAIALGDSPAMAEEALAWLALAPDAFPEASAMPDVHWYSGATLAEGRAATVRAGAQLYLCRAFHHCAAGGLRALALGVTPDGKMVDVESRIRQQVSPLQWQVAEQMAASLLAWRAERGRGP